MSSWAQTRLRLCHRDPDVHQVRRSVAQLLPTFRQIWQVPRDPRSTAASSGFVQRLSSLWLNTLIIVSSLCSGRDRRGLDEAESSAAASRLHPEGWNVSGGVLALASRREAAVLTWPIGKGLAGAWTELEGVRERFGLRQAEWSVHTDVCHRVAMKALSRLS